MNDTTTTYERAADLSPSAHMPAEDTNVVRRGLVGWTIWLAGLIVALGAAVATAHGLYVVALAAGAPQPIAWLYPLMTDGLALVAYAASARLTGRGRRYAWTVVVLAAGLSGLAQASYLAGGVASAPTGLRFGVGAWPAVAAAIVAHLLFLLGTTRATSSRVQAERAETVQSDIVQGLQSEVVQGVQTGTGQAVQPAGACPVQLEPWAPVQPGERSSVEPTRVTDMNHGGATSRESAKDRALAAAQRHANDLGGLPSARALMAMAGVSRGTAATALQELRGPATQPLHLIGQSSESSTTL